MVHSAAAAAVVPFLLANPSSARHLPVGTPSRALAVISDPEALAAIAPATTRGTVRRAL